VNITGMKGFLKIKLPNRTQIRNVFFDIADLDLAKDFLEK